MLMRLENKELWVLIFLLLPSRVYFVSCWMVRLKRLGPTLLVHARGTDSTINMQLVLHKWLAGVCFSSHGEMRFAMEGLSKGYKISNFYITVVVLWCGMANVWFVIMYAMIMFVIFHHLHVDEYGNRLEPYGCLLFYVTCVSLNHHVIALLYC